MLFIINSNTNWDDPPRARHQIAYSLSKKNSVKFISANKIGFPKIKTLIINENLTIFQPYFPIDSRVRYRLPFFNEFYQNWLFRKTISLLDKDINSYYVINSDFTASRIFKYFKNIAYYCNDDFISMNMRFKLPIVAKFHIKWENELIKNANFCIATSNYLTNKLKEKNNNVYEIPLGAPDIKQFGVKANFNINDTDNINVGLVGFITIDNISTKIINTLLDHPKIRITFIGPVNKKFLKRIEKKEKIILKGILTGKELFNEIKNFDVAIAPYFIEKINKGGTPNKLWQYLALGKPVVVSCLPAIRDWAFPEGCVYKSTNKDFLELVLKAHEENTTDLIKQRLLIANNNTWDKKVEKIIELFRKHIL